MDINTVFISQFALSLLVVALLASWFARPWLNTKDTPDALLWLSVPHAFRHLGLVFLVPGVVSPDLPSVFAGAAGYGDLAAGILAIFALIALRARWSIMIPLTWAMNIVGTVDLANALRQFDVIAHLQAAWYIPTFVVPVLLVTHFMIFARLIGEFRRPAAGVQTAR